MRFFYESSTETEESELEGGSGGHEHGRIPRDVKGKGKAREVSKSASPRRSLGVRISVPPRSSSGRLADDRSRLRASTSSDSSVSVEDGEDDSSDDDDEDDSSNDDDSSGETDGVFSDSDSEEDEFPVNPTKADLANRRRLSQYPAQSDPLESYLAKQQKKAWQQAQASHNRDLAALRSIRLNAFTQASEQRKKQQAEELELTRMLLEGLNMKRQKEEEEIDKEFKSRNQSRWNEINRTIANLEKAENEALANARRKEQEAEERARKMREEEMKKIEAEKEEQRKKLEEQQRKEKEAQDQKAKAEQAANERARKEKEDAAKATATASSSGAATPVSSSTPPTSSGSYLLDSKRDFERWHAKIKELKETVLPAVSNNKDLKNACWKLKRSLTTRISNVSASKEDIQNTTSAIHNLLNDAKSASEQAYLWSVNLLSKKLTEMAGNNSEHDLSPVTFALAQVVVALLLAGHTPLGEILMARLVKRCPYIVPFFPSKGTLSPDEHSKLLGRKEGEPSISYKQRMSGMISLYAAIVQTSPGDVPQLSPTPSLSSIPPHFRPEGGWRWLALIVRPPLPLLEVTPLLLHTFLRMSSERFHTLFGKQYIKLLRAIAEQGIDERKVKWNEGVQGDLSKIRLMIGEWMEKGQIIGAEGRIPS